jgi:hypothetical protein
MSHEFSDLVNELLSDYVKICFPSVETQCVLSHHIYSSKSGRKICFRPLF